MILTFHWTPLAYGHKQYGAQIILTELLSTSLWVQKIPILEHFANLLQAHFVAVK